MIEFRWVALLTLWTMLIGPVLDMPFGSPQAQPEPPAKMARPR